MWSANSVVVGAVPPMSVKRADIWPREFLSIKKPDPPVGQHVVERCGVLSAFNDRLIDQCQDSEKLMTIETLLISRCKPQLRTRDEYKSRELTLKY